MEASIRTVRVADNTLAVDLEDGRTISVPLNWFPRLRHGSPAQRGKWELIGEGEGVHWPDLDDDISVEGLLEGVPSQESPGSLRGWLRLREARSSG